MQRAGQVLARVDRTPFRARCSSERPAHPRTLGVEALSTEDLALPLEKPRRCWIHKHQSEHAFRVCRRKRLRIRTTKRVRYENYRLSGTDRVEQCAERLHFTLC
jgi:hypothetical protein